MLRNDQIFFSRRDIVCNTLFFCAADFYEISYPKYTKCFTVFGQIMWIVFYSRYAESFISEAWQLLKNKFACQCFMCNTNIFIYLVCIFELLNWLNLILMTENQFFLFNTISSLFNSKTYTLNRFISYSIKDQIPDKVCVCVLNIFFIHFYWLTLNYVIIYFVLWWLPLSYNIVNDECVRFIRIILSILS